MEKYISTQKLVYFPTARSAIGGQDRWSHFASAKTELGLWRQLESAL